LLELLPLVIVPVAVHTAVLLVLDIVVLPASTLLLGTLLSIQLLISTTTPAV
jgi:hypothetical protein